MSDKYISSVVANLPFSGIRKYFDVVNEMEDAVSLGVGEPDFYTPWNIREEAIYTIENRRTSYSSNAGMVELRKEISKYLSRTINVDYEPMSQVLVTVGASEGIDVCLRTILDPGDEVLLVEPCYVSYSPCIIMAGGVPISVPTKVENNFKLTVKDFQDKITKKTKAIIISFPNNPTGAVMEKSELEKVSKLFIAHDILVISDEIYCDLTYGDLEHVSIASLPKMYERTIVINGFSKAHSMTGWRLGYAAGPVEIIKNMTKVHQYIIMCAPTISQYAGIEALKNGKKNVTKMKIEYDSRRKLMVDGFKKIGLSCFEPLGAFYLFPSVKETGLSSEEFCNRILYQEKLAVVPGEAFGECGSGFIRCSYAYSEDNLKEALTRMDKFLQSL